MGKIQQYTSQENTNEQNLSNIILYDPNQGKNKNSKEHDQSMHNRRKKLNNDHMKVKWNIVN